MDTKRDKTIQCPHGYIKSCYRCDVSENTEPLTKEDIEIVYLVVTGSYSDYSVRKVCVDRTLAEQWVEFYKETNEDHPDIEEKEVTTTIPGGIVSVLHMDISSHNLVQREWISRRDANQHNAECYTGYSHKPGIRKAHRYRVVTGNISVHGTNFEKVRKVFGEKKAEFLVQIQELQEIIDQGLVWPENE